VSHHLVRVSQHSLILLN